MGLFDSFIIKDLKCPKGHIQLDGELQTKALGSNMLRFKQGKKVRIRTLNTDVVIGEGHVNCYIFCEECNEGYDYLAIIKKGKFIGIRKIKNFR